jgi:hypothetical protein
MEDAILDPNAAYKSAPRGGMLACCQRCADDRGESAAVRRDTNARSHLQIQTHVPEPREAGTTWGGHRFGLACTMSLTWLLSQGGSSTPPSTQWIVLSVGVLAIVYLLMRGRARLKDPLDPVSRAARPRLMSPAEQRGVERDMSNLLIELSEMARQVSAQLDTRAAKLDLLIREADQKIRQLRQLTGEQAPAADGEPDEPASSAPLETWSPPDAQPATPEPSPADAGTAEESDPRHARIYAMADAGHSAQDIAREIGRPSGEVELILALRPRES